MNSVGKQIEYLSLPWKSIVGHAVRTAGKYVDFDTEVCFWTEKGFIPGRPGRGEDDPPVEPEPWVSYFELDFNKSKVDMTKLNYYLSKRLLHLSKMDPGAPIPMDQMTEAYETSNFEQFLQWIGGDQRELDPKKIDHELHTKTKILLDEEKVLMAFKAGRDTSLFTNLRVLLLDVQGLINKKVEYQSIPYKSIYAWSVETAGMWDRDTEVSTYDNIQFCRIMMMDTSKELAPLILLYTYFFSLAELVHSESLVWNGQSRNGFQNGEM